MRRMCSVTVPSSCHVDEESHTRASSCSRLKTWLGEAGQKGQEVELLHGGLDQLAVILTSRAEVSIDSSPNRMVSLAETRVGVARAARSSPVPPARDRRRAW